MVVEHREKGVLHGQVQKFHADGQVDVSHWVDGVQHGPFWGFQSDGKAWSETLYEHGAEVPGTTAYVESGAVGEYRSLEDFGARDGTTKWALTKADGEKVGVFQDNWFVCAESDRWMCSSTILSIKNWLRTLIFYF